MRHLIAFIVAFLALSQVPATLGAANGKQGHDIRPLLRERHFIHPLNGRETIDYAGHIRAGGRNYDIYVYTGVVRAHPQGVDHGLTRIIVIRDGKSLLGQYALAAPTHCRVRGKSVECETKYPGRSFEFDDNGPPKKIWLDGEESTFFPASEDDI